MTRSVWVTALGSEFDNFLFAPIAEEGNGMMLSVISALARLNLDPWQEANNLAGLPSETATKRLASLLIAALPDGPSTSRNPETIAARLTALLPSRASANITRSKALFGADETTKLRLGIVMFVFFAAFMLASQWFVASHQQSAQDDNAPAHAAGTVSPQLLPPNSGE